MNGVALIKHRNQQKKTLYSFNIDNISNVFCFFLLKVRDLNC